MSVWTLIFSVVNDKLPVYLIVSERQFQDMWYQARL